MVPIRLIPERTQRNPAKLVGFTGMNSADVLALYERGVALSGAPLAYCPDQVRNELASLSQTYSLADFLALTFAHTKQDLPGEEQAAAYEQMQHASSRRSELERYNKANLLRWLRNRELLAFGYALPRSPGDVPAQIPLDLWQQEPKWSKSTLKGNGLEFVGVRVCLPPQEDLPQQDGPGRPSLAMAIHHAFDSLVELDAIDLTQSLRSQYGKIRQRVHLIHPGLTEGDKGMSDNTLQAHLGEKFRGLKG